MTNISLNTQGTEHFHKTLPLDLKSMLPSMFLFLSIKIQRLKNYPKPSLTQNIFTWIPLHLEWVLVACSAPFQRKTFTMLDIFMTSFMF